MTAGRRARVFISPNHHPARSAAPERIQARAIRRCGELLKQIEPGTGAHWENKRDGADTLTRTTAATQAGLSERQKVTALRVAMQSDYPLTILGMSM